ncbi:MAG: SPASM domain-containing protein, partial [Candidatus Nitrotoga sp.]
AGEPTLQWNLIEECISYARNEGKNVGLRPRFIITTNLCISKKKVKFIGEEIDTIYVSCDGPPDVMDRNRPIAFGKTSSGSMIEAALGWLNEYGNIGKVTVRATITKDTQIRQEEFIRYFCDFNIHRIYFVPVSDTGRGETDACVNAKIFVENWERAQMRALSLNAELLLPILDLNRLRLDGFACGINGSNFVVLPDDSISLCYEAVVPESKQASTFKVGHFDNLQNHFEIDIATINAIRKNFHVDRRIVCDTCFCKPTCAGKCAAREMEPGDFPRNHGMTDTCDITRYLTFKEIKRCLTKEE